MQKISNKSRDALYATVSDEIMTARINIDKLNIFDKNIKNQIDEIMFRLQWNASQKAIDCFIHSRK